MGPELDTLVAAPRSNGKPLAADVRQTMQRRFGRDFSGVRVHATSADGLAARRLGARAYTQGSDITFGSGEYRPDTQAGLGLLAHELTHVIQQRNGAGGEQARPAAARVGLEREAESAERAAPSAPVAVQGAARHGSVQRSPGIVDWIVGRTFGNLKEAADFVIDKSGLAKNPTIAALRGIQARFSGLGTVWVPPETAADLEALYVEAKRRMPSWVPVPKLSFAGPKAMMAAVVIPIVGIGVALLALLYAILFVLSAAVVAYLIHRLIESLKFSRGDPEEAPEAKDKPKEQPKPEVKEEPKVKDEPKTDPKPEPDPKLKPDDRPRPPLPPVPGPYPLCWPVQLHPPGGMFFARVKSPDRDYDEAQQARLRLEWRKLRDEDFEPKRFHVHHRTPLFLGGADDLRANGVILPALQHLHGHRVLRQQPQMLTPPPGLPPLPADIYKHPAGTPYYLKGYKVTEAEVCE